MPVSTALKSFFFLIAVFALALFTIVDRHQLSWRLKALPVDAAVKSLAEAKYIRGFITSPSLTPSVHAPAISELSDSSLLAAWYGGEREGAKDVALYSSILRASGSGWTTPVKALDRQRVAADLGIYIRKLGNPVLLSGSDLNVWMFFVTTSIGGWSTSSINMARSTDGGKSWGGVKRLISSPFLNISTLVKGQPFFYQDGTIGLPVYHELAGKFSELLRLDRNGLVHDKVRLTHGRGDIQPDISIIDENTLLAVLRDTSGTGKIFQTGSRDGGKSWAIATETELPNPNSAVAITGDKDGLILAYNDSNSDRNPLSLALSTDEGKSWRKIDDIEASEMRADNNKDEFSYPHIIQSRDAVYHMVYTWKRERVAYLSFNVAWIKSRLSSF